MMDVAAWRRGKRVELYAARKAMTAEQRHHAAHEIARGLDDHCTRHKPTLVGLKTGQSSTSPTCSHGHAHGLRACGFAYRWWFRGDSLSNIGVGYQATRCSQLCGRFRCRPAGTLSRPI